jgi:hypothetical protein
VRLEPRQRGAGDADDRLLHLRGELGDEMVGEQRNVLDPLAQDGSRTGMTLIR